MTDREQLDTKLEQGEARDEQAAQGLTGDAPAKRTGMLHEAEDKMRDVADKVKDAVQSAMHRNKH